MHLAFRLLVVIMKRVHRLEKNLCGSFDRVKSDILKINSDITRLSTAVSSIVEDKKEIMDSIKDLEKQQRKIFMGLEVVSRKVSSLESSLHSTNGHVRVLEAEKSLSEKKIIPSRSNKQRKTSPKKVQYYIASKKGSTFFPNDSVQAKNIKPENRVIFKSKKAMLRRGYKPSKLYIKRT